MNSRARVEKAIIRQRRRENTLTEELFQQIKKELDNYMKPLFAAEIALARSILFSDPERRSKYPRRKRYRD